MLNSKYKIIAYFCCALVCAFLGLGLSKDSLLAQTTQPFGSFSNGDISVGSTGDIVDYVLHLSRGAYVSFDINERKLYFITSSLGRFTFNSSRVWEDGHSSPGLSGSASSPVFTLAPSFYIYTTEVANNLPLDFNFIIPTFDSSRFSSSADLYNWLLNGGDPDSTLDENLGVLNASIRQLNITGNNNQVHNQIYRVNWQSKSSTGFDVTSSGVHIDLKARLSYKPSGSNGDVSYMADYPSVNGSVQTFDFDYNQLMSYGSEVVQAWRDDSVFNRGTLSRRFYLRINDTNTNSVGHWVEIYPIVEGEDFIPGDRGHGGSSVVDIDSDGNVTVLDELPDIDVDYGSGETVDDASNNADSNQNINIPKPSDFEDIDFSDIVSGIKGALSSFTSTVTSFISLVSATLSFLPKWVLNFFALSIAIWCIMLVKRAIF